MKEFCFLNYIKILVNKHLMYSNPRKYSYGIETGDFAYNNKDKIVIITVIYYYLILAYVHPV